MSRSFAGVAAAAVLGVAFLGGCSTGPVSKQDVCDKFDQLGRHALRATGLIDTMVFAAAADLADRVGRYTGPEDLSADARRLTAIADSSGTDTVELANATVRVAGLCGHSLGMSTLSADNGAQGEYAAPSTPPPQIPGYTPPPAPRPSATADSSRRVDAPGGLSATVPASFQPTSAPSAANVQVADPARPDAFLRFGGSAAPKTPLLAEIQAGERGNPNIRDGYRRVRLTTVAFRGTSAVDWEFTFSKDGRTRHAWGRYWRVGSTGYVVYASAPVDQWDELLAVFAPVLDSVATAR